MIRHSDIRAILPHRYPMLLVDAVLSIEPARRIVAIKNISRNEPWFARLDPDTPCAYPPSLIIESFCQSAGILQVLSERETNAVGEQVMLFGSMSHVQIHSAALAGETLIHDARLETAMSDAAVFSGEVRTRDRLIATVGRVVVALRPAQALATGSSEAQDRPTLAGAAAGSA